MESILNWYREEGLIFKGGSGAGLNLSRIRSSKELLSSGGTASGPVSFMRGADASAGTIKSGGATRRAAKMVVLDVDHPDIEEFVETKAKEQAKVVKEQAEKLRKSIKSCSDFQARAKETGMPESGDMGTMRVKDMAPGLQNLALGIPVGQASPVLMSPAAAVILIVCKRDVPMIQAPPQAQPAPPPPPAPTPIQEAKLPGRDEIERELIAERAELLSRRYLRDLRRTAFIETRL